ncbi:voltage-dependent anion-selective channel protein 2-like [Sycon ciliatum]|uniref:voltage-dependent anion-selective channel protein 2-like n=1 Tax=Sycon ciliatum TaxID=27933 RepID=UPI0020A8B797|eukprot:scpid80211/ scgid18190/ Voltage-dependent anion-selective channel protein 2; Outer mitochondrial membrane protein porin 2; Voltage-dependent anion-selective channel protein 6
MSTPPCFSDIGKNASDLFKKGYSHGQVKLEASSQAKNGCEFKAITTSEGSRISGSLETKQRVSKYGLTLTGKWNTDNAFNVNVAVENQFVDGLKLTLDSTIAPHTSRKSNKAKAAYKRPHFNGAASVNVDAKGTTLSVEDVFSYEKVVGGFSTSYNVTNGQLGNHSIQLGYESSDFACAAGVSNFTRDQGMEITGSLFHKVCSKLHAGAQARHVAGVADSSSIEIATKYASDPSSTLQAKVNTRGLLGLSYAVNMRKGVKITLSSLVDAVHLDQPNHRLGVSIDLSGK